MTLRVPVATSDTVRKFFDELCLRRGFRILLADYRPDVFGNIQIVASNERYSIDYRRDRGDETVFVVVAAKEYLVEDVQGLTGRSTPSLNDLQAELAFLLDVSSEVDRLCSADSVETSVAALEKMRVQRLHRMIPGSVAPN